MPGKRIAVLGDTSDHGGTVVTTNQDGTLIVTVGGGFTPPVTVGGMFGSFMWGELLMAGGDAVGLLPAIEGALHSCPIPGHGVTAITAVTVKSYHNSRLILTYYAVAGCGARITPLDRRVYVE
jgi:uncharacterized Zn-binding protein involved in type VI secretion